MPQHCPWTFALSRRLVLLALLALVSADDPPEIVTRPRDQTALNGGIISFTCAATGHPKPRIEWRRNNRRGLPSRYMVLETSQGSILRIEPVRANRDDGKYECVAENGVGDPVTAETQLNVLKEDSLPSGFPRIINHPQLRAVERGRTVVLQCQAQGNPDPEITWYKDSLPLDMTNQRYTLVAHGLQITDSTEEDEGKYECAAENDAGTSFSYSATLYVRVRRVPPHFSIPPESLYEVTPGGDLNITCVAVGSPMPFVKWRKGAIDLTPEDNLPIGKNVLTLENVQESANYTCIAASKLGSLEATAQVIVQALPRPPTNVRVSDVTATSVRLAWSYDIGSETIIYYVIQYKPRSSNQEFSEISGVTTMYYTVRDLSSFTEYEFYVLAVNNIGRGSPSTPAVVTTGETKPGSAPRNAHPQPISSTTVLIQWNEPEEPNGQIIGYIVYYTTNPNLPITQWKSQNVDINRLTTISDLTPLTVYTVRVQASTSIGPGPLSAPVQVKTQTGVPSQPTSLRSISNSATSVTLTWQRPMHPGDSLMSYELYWKDSFTGESNHRSIPVNEQYTLTSLLPNTVYHVWVSAHSRQGEGAPTQPITVKTEQFVPGEPRKIRVTVINSTTVLVEWQPPGEKHQNGIIRGYQIHVQEVNEADDLVNEPIRFDNPDGNAQDFNVSGLQPDTKYSIQVSAFTRKGDGTRSKAKFVRTPGGVPNRPALTLTVAQEEPTVTVEARWIRPSQIHGQLLGYRLKYGVKGSTGPMTELELPGPDANYKRIEGLRKGMTYEVRVAGKNNVGFGQEAVEVIKAPDGVPSAPPQNVSFRLQSPLHVVIWWDPPPPDQTHGEIINYTVYFQKGADTSGAILRNVSSTREVFTDLSEETSYSIKVLAYTSKGGSPWSNVIEFRTLAGYPPTPANVKGLSTSDTSIEVWWDKVPDRPDVVGYRVFYTVSAVADLDAWNQTDVSLTSSAGITNLERHAVYAVQVAALTNQSVIGRLSDPIMVRVSPEHVPLNLQASGVTTHTMTLSWRPPIKMDPLKYKISYGANKEFTNSHYHAQKLVITPRWVYVDPEAQSYTIHDLSPFTTYQVNVTAVADDESYRPPAQIKVTTAMAAPLPMVKPDFSDIVNGNEINVFLPRASEEYGPISHYYVVVVPDESATKTPDQYSLAELTSPSKPPPEAPYIAAKFHRTIQYSFNLGDGEKYEGFINYRLERKRKYQIFVRAVVDTPQLNLYTSSPFSDPLHLDMSNSRSAGSAAIAPRPVPTSDSREEPHVTAVGQSAQGTGLVWIFACVVAVGGIAISLGIMFVVRRRRQSLKSPDLSTVTKPLMSDIPPHPSDPVEMRRLNFQTPAMISHPPIPIFELESHIDRLKGNDNLKFSQEYESIEPGQQFTWDNSNLEVNKPKNRYANVIAYDHSRVVLQPTDIQGSDYINANYCDGYRKQNAYVATQGPLPDTFGEFWRMVWELRSATIVMMTKLEERTRIKCDQYWPSRGSDTYGAINVTLADVQELATYCIRTFQLTRIGHLERREVRQYQFTAWPDHGVPDHPAPFLMFLRRVRNMNPLDSGAAIVHCSAGVGRTGAFIVIDSMLERIKHEHTVDIYGHVTCLRAQRNYMVQTEDQYVFIHDALLEAVQCGQTEVPARNLYAHIQKLSMPDPNENNASGMELEFKKLATVKTPPAKFVSANTPCNKMKNRLVNILPYEVNRVCLQPLRGVEGSDYINASFIDGYRYRNAYVASQGPLENTTDDFWRMLWEHNSTIIVMLTKLREMGREKCHQYWPGERSQRYQYFVVDPIAEYNMPQYILREFKVTDARDGQSRTIRQFQYTDWPEQDVPKSGDGFIDFIGQVHKTKEQFGQEGPITVHCSAGIGRTGVFITLSIVLERMQYEGVVDLFQTVRMLRIQRPAMVQTQEQYQFAYRAALEYLGSFDHYAN